jgi:hypothetical protein
MSTPQPNVMQQVKDGLQLLLRMTLHQLKEVNRRIPMQMAYL